MQTARAHFDGRTILVDEPIELKANDKLLVMVLEEKPEDLSASELDEAQLIDTSKDDFLSKKELERYLCLDAE